MDRTMLEEHLAMAQRHAEEGERHITRQREIIAEIQARNGDATEAKRLLANFVGSQKLHLQDIERLISELGRAS
jgi:hypothetical protein